MKLQIKKTVEDFIEVETPSFWKDKTIEHYFMVKEDGIIWVTNGQITVVESTSEEWFARTLSDVIKQERITEVIFLEKLFDVQDSINSKAGISPIPTIFTQNKFSSFQ